MMSIMLPVRHNVLMLGDISRIVYLLRFNVQSVQLYSKPVPLSIFLFVSGTILSPGWQSKVLPALCQRLL